MPNNDTFCLSRHSNLLVLAVGGQGPEVEHESENARKSRKRSHEDERNLDASHVRLDNSWHSFWREHGADLCRAGRDDLEGVDARCCSSECADESVHEARLRGGHGEGAAEELEDWKS